ncbi:Exportin-6, partial [Chamberlinius hualienensis]
MSFDSDSLRSLETLMTEFFDLRTSNDRKRQIEGLLTNFSNDRESWKHCLYFLANTRNEYVMMYCMTVLENLINKQWVGLLGVNRMEIRSSLYKLLLAHHSEFATFLRNKLVKLVVDIGRLDWPHFYPDFFTNILQLSQQPETMALGLVMLQTTSEEMISPRENLSISRKEELHRLLLDQVPSVLNLLTGILESVVEKYQHIVTATPPPSPTHGQSNSMDILFSTTPLQTGNLLTSAFKSLSNKNPFHNLTSLDPESHYLCQQALNCLVQLFGWIPLSVHISPNLLNIIFHYANLGCESVHQNSFNHQNAHCLSHSSSSSSTSSHFSFQSQFNSNSLNNCGPSLAVIAMSCINEIISKNCVPSDFDDFLLHMFQNAYYLLQRITKECNSNNSIMPSTDNWLSSLDESFLEKFTEFLRLFIGVHFRRFEGNAQFPVLEFLSLFFKYTFQQPTKEGYFICLEIWTIFLDFLSHKVKDGKQPSTVEAYSEALLSLVVQINNKLQFKFNQAELEELDDETLNYDQETEWQQFLHQCLDVIAKVAELLPEETCHILYTSFLENMQTYLGLEQFVVMDGMNRRLTITGENECPRLHCVLRDLASGLQTFGVLADRFTGESFLPWYNQTRDIVEKVCHMASYGSRVCLFNVTTAAPNVLQADFIEV